MIYDLEGKAKYVSPAFTQTFGWTMNEVVGKPIPFLLASEMGEGKTFTNDLVRNGPPVYGFETQRYAKNGRLLDVSISASRYVDHEGNPAGILEIIRDISERKRLESQLQQTQKMEAIGTLSGCIAHDFNNILTPIMIHAEMALLDISDQASLRSHVKDILKASHRAKRLIKQILDFSRQGEQERKRLQVGLIVKEALKLLRASLPTTIEIRQRIETAGRVLADPTKIHQIIMNLCSNAAQAMRDKGGVLEVSLTDLSLDVEAAQEFHDLSPGSYVRLIVSDTGHGMEKWITERIFEPYFTTKEKSEGTGLGLAVVHGIVKSYGGTITVDSRPGEGTAFHILLPRIEGRLAPDPEPPGELPVGAECILFVDDEEPVVQVAKSMLKRLGYEIVASTDSLEALEMFRAQPDKFDLVITDQTMPNMTGADLSGELQRIRPEIPIILCTGYSELIDEQRAKAIGIREFVMKLIAAHEIARTIRRALDT